METWEYDVLSFPLEQGTETKAKLNEMGAQGWRVKSITPVMNTSPSFMGGSPAGEAATTRALVFILEREKVVPRQPAPASQRDVSGSRQRDDISAVYGSGLDTPS